MSNHDSLSAFVDSFAKLDFYFFIFFILLALPTKPGKDIIVFRFIIEYIVA
jgi:hypothetical protein